MGRLSARGREGKKKGLTTKGGFGGVRFRRIDDDDLTR